MSKQALINTHPISDGLKDTFKRNIRKLRDDWGYTQAKLAELSDISTRYVGQIESGTIPEMGIIEALARSLGVSVSYLFTDPDKQQMSMAQLLQVAAQNLDVLELLHKLPATSERIKKAKAVLQG